MDNNGYVVYRNYNSDACLDKIPYNMTMFGDVGKSHKDVKNRHIKCERKKKKTPNKHRKNKNRGNLKRQIDQKCNVSSRTFSEWEWEWE